jgi:site-specific DNA recombinase
MTTAIIYCRFSPRPNADECTSNERQEERCLAYCASHEYAVEGIFKDSNVSGGTIDRYGLRRALDSLGKDWVLVCDSSDRLARDMLVALTIQHQVAQRGARIEYANGTPPGTTPEGELMGNILAAYAHYQRQIIRRTTKAGLARKKANGVALGRCPIGYCRQGGKLVPDPDEQTVIAGIIALVNLGYSVTYVTSICQQKYGLIRGRPWNEKTIRRIIAREKGKESS